MTPLHRSAYAPSPCAPSPCAPSPLSTSSARLHPPCPEALPRPQGALGAAHRAARRLGLALGCWSLIACAFFPAAPACAALADGVAAAVNYEVIALSLLDAYRAAYAPQQPALDALEHLIDERLLATQALRYGLSVPEDEVAAALAASPRPAGLTPREWERLVGDHLLAQRFLDYRFGDFVPVGREELRQYHAAHRDRFPGSFEASEEAVRAELVPTIRAKRERDYTDGLRDRADVRLNAGLVVQARP